MTSSTAAVEVAVMATNFVETENNLRSAMLEYAARKAAVFPVTVPL